MLWIHSFCTIRLVSYSGYMHLHAQSHACPAHGMHAHKPCWEHSGTCNSCTVLAWDAEELHARAAGGKANSILPAGGCADDNSVTAGRRPSWLGKRLKEVLVGSQTVTVASNLAQRVSHLGVKPTRSKRKGHCSICVSSYQTVFFPGMNDSVWKAERETKTCVLGKTRVTELSAASECFCYLIHPF